jgi:hypothetical protein
MVSNFFSKSIELFEKELVQCTFPAIFVLYLYEKYVHLFSGALYNKINSKVPLSRCTKYVSCKLLQLKISFACHSL